MSDIFDLSLLPLSAYTPGMGDTKMEGKYETATGAPMYTYEQYMAGEAPYVTGATSDKKPSGATVMRTIGGVQVPVRITDYGPGVKGIDIASSNPKWATDFPYQGHTELTAGSPLLAKVGGGAGGGADVGGGYTDTSGTEPYGLATSNASAGTGVQTGLGILAKGLEIAGSQIGKSSQQGSEQVMAMLKKKPSALDAILQSIAGSYGAVPQASPYGFG